VAGLHLLCRSWQSLLPLRGTLMLAARAGLVQQLLQLQPILLQQPAQPRLRLLPPAAAAAAAWMGLLRCACWFDGLRAWRRRRAQLCCPLLHKLRQLLQRALHSRKAVLTQRLLLLLLLLLGATGIMGGLRQLVRRCCGRKLSSQLLQGRGHLRQPVCRPGLLPQSLLPLLLQLPGCWISTSRWRCCCLLCSSCIEERAKLQPGVVCGDCSTEGVCG
jgi:hypothetical protein